MELILKEEVYDIIGAAMEVYKQLGQGFLEPVYQEALEIEFQLRQVPFESQKELEIFYKNRKLKKQYIPDFVCFDQIIVEIKALDKLTSKEWSQLMNYLKATGIKLGLLINFGSKNGIEWKRIVL